MVNLPGNARTPAQRMHPFHHVRTLDRGPVPTVTPPKPSRVRPHPKLRLPDERDRAASVHAAALRGRQRHLHPKCGKHRAGLVRDGPQVGKPRHRNDAVQSENVQQGVVPVDKVCRQVPVRHVRPHGTAHVGLPHGGHGEGTEPDPAAGAERDPLHAALH
uniref:(northern house mosquito) hypothetical protein n=1 Tax=Culex pipiens TaxID=7175 RepID=A0A8D8NA59_CULPI